MMIPAAMNIYSAMDALKKRDPKIVDDELKELVSSNAENSMDSQTGREATFRAGYLLGLETARCILMGMPAIYQAGLKPEDLL